MGVRDGGRVEGFVAGIEVNFEDLFAALFQPTGEVPKEMSDRALQQQDTVAESVRVCRLLLILAIIIISIFIVR